MPRLLLTTLALTAALSASPATAVAPTPNVEGIMASAIAGGHLRGASNKMAGRVLPSLFPRGDNGNGNGNGGAPSQPQQPAVDPVGPPTPTTSTTKPSTDAGNDSESGGNGGLPHIPVPVSTTSTTTVTMDDGSALTIKCTDGDCTACAVGPAPEHEDLGCQSIVCDDDGDCSIVDGDDNGNGGGDHSPTGVAVDNPKPERVPEPRTKPTPKTKPAPVTEQKADPPATTEANGNENGN